MTDDMPKVGASQPTLFDVQPRVREGETLKRCPLCEMDLPVEQFSVTKRYASGEVARHHYCKPCRQSQESVVYQARRSGLYRRLYIKQEGCCFVCGTSDETLCVDHDHQTRRVRALLCQGCNKAAGFMKDNPGTAYAMYMYLANGGAVRRSLGMDEIGQ